MTFFSYSCASFGWPVIGPAMSTIFFGLSAARLKNEQNSKANGIKSGRNLRRLIGDGESVDDLRREARASVHDDLHRSAENWQNAENPLISGQRVVPVSV